MVVTTTAPKARMSQTSAGLTVRMLPKRMAKRSALKPRARLISTTASAKPPERKTASAASPWSAPRERSRSMPSAPATVTTRAPRTGEAPTRSPSATPASATCASVSAIRESRRGTRKTPISGQTTAMTAPATNARCMKPNWRKSGMGLVVVAHDANRRPVQRRQGRVAQEIAGAAVEDEPPVQAGELRDLFGDDADVVADEDEGDLALAVQVLEHGVEGGLRLGVHAAGGLVQDDQLGVGDQRAGDQHALLLSGRERADARPRVRLHADAGQRVGDAGSLRPADTLEETEARHEAGGDHLVHGHGQGRVERGPLRDVAQSPPLPECGRRLAEEPHRALLGLQ